MTYRIPYKELEMLGISRQAVDAMPDTLRTDIMSGNLTPLIWVERNMHKGVSLIMPFKLQMQEDINGKQHLVVYPMNKDMANSANLSNEKFNELNAGAVVRMDGKYLQRDPETNCVIEKTERELDIDRRIAELEKVRDIELGTQQKAQLKEGRAVELNVGGELVTVGLDLRDKEHFKTLKGDMTEWQRQKEIAYDILHPEYVGIVQTDENRWEQQMVKKEGLNSQTLKERPAQTRSGGMKI